MSTTNTMKLPLEVQLKDLFNNKNKDTYKELENLSIENGFDRVRRIWKDLVHQDSANNQLSKKDVKHLIGNLQEKKKVF